MRYKKSVIYSTTDYAMFELNPIRRELHTDRKLLASMKKYGFLPPCFIHVYRAEKGSRKLRVVSGHHRLAYAQQLGLPVYFMIDDTCTDVLFLESMQHYHRPHGPRTALIPARVGQ